MITPIDIQTREFTKAVRGYREDEVDGFLDLIAGDVEKMIEENLRLREQLKTISAELHRYKTTEGIVLETLEATKALMGDISASAEKRAEIVLKNAELDAELTVREAREAAERYKEETVSLRNSLTIFRTRYRTLLESELEKFDQLSTELFGGSDIEELDAIFSLPKPGEGRSAPVPERVDVGGTKVALAPVGSLEQTQVHGRFLPEELQGAAADEPMAAGEATEAIAEPTEKPEKPENEAAPVASTEAVQAESNWAQTQAHDRFAATEPTIPFPAQGTIPTDASESG